MPTLASVAGTTVSGEYGTIDGVNFYNSLQGIQDSIRPWVFFHWQDAAMNDYHRWAQTARYKQYDVTDRSKFIHYAVDPLELNPIPNSSRTAEQKAASKMLKAVLDSLHL